MDPNITDFHMKEVFTLFDMASNALIDFYEFNRALTK